MGLVADDEVERFELAAVLGLGDHVNGLVGREDHGHRLGLAVRLGQA